MPYPDIYNARPKVNKTAFVDNLLDAMASFNTDCGLYRLLRCESRDIHDFLSRYEVTLNFADSVNLANANVQGVFAKYVENLSVPVEVLTDLEKSTREQGVNPNWLKARTVLITASNMGSIVKRKKVEPDNLVARMVYPKEITGVKSLSYGRKNESRARLEYARWHILKCGTVEIEERGLIVNANMPYLGASVDGVVHCDKCGTGLVEIKCPYGKQNQKWRNMLPLECAKSTEFCCEVIEENLKLKATHDYYQVQGQMAVCTLGWVDFVIWTKKGLAVERIESDQVFWSQMEQQLKAFYIRGIVGEVYTSRIKRNIKLC